MFEQIAANKRRTVILICLFVMIWLGIGAAIGALIAAWAQAGRTPRDVLIGLLIAAVAATVGVLFTLHSGTRIVLGVAGAHPADPYRHGHVIHLVEALALGSGLPVPAVFVVNDPSPNAFATGIDPQHAAVTVTTGLLAVMDREELEGVLAHEMSHIRNYDTRLLLVVSTLIGMAGLLAGLLWRSAFVTRGRGRNGGQIALIMVVAGVLLSIVGFILGPIIRLALSRRRESLADVSGVALTRNPVGLIRALRTLQANDRPLAHANHATAAMCIDDPLQHHRGSVHRLFDTHPPIAERIAVLEGVAQGLTV